MPRRHDLSSVSLLRLIFACVRSYDETEREKDFRKTFHQILERHYQHRHQQDFVRGERRVEENEEGLLSRSPPRAVPLLHRTENKLNRLRRLSRGRPLRELANRAILYRTPKRNLRAARKNLQRVIEGPPRRPPHT